ncbi:endo alpha-1,4 polygalactosaminidase [Kineococcus sp. LSe6-4]|uniref:Endo alpha-1,4 polygalactosaminidase n=1 Tax=Kineococcus halophytocola TaxID=3234027 RepID=A0ABV4GY10_9ACTN
MAWIDHHDRRRATSLAVAAAITAVLSCLPGCTQDGRGTAGATTVPAPRAGGGQEMVERDPQVHVPRRERRVRPPAPARWQPQPGSAWQWQLSGELDLSLDVPVYDVDWEVPRSVVDRLRADGRRVICYVSVGTVESYREDADSFPEVVRGEPLADWPDERWLDVRRLDLLAEPLLRRLDVCRAKGFDAVEPDNVDAYTNRSGFPLTAQDQLRFNRWIARAAHERGLAVGLKNDVGQAAELVDDFDFAVNEQCRRYEECDALQPFVAAGKAVFHVEYGMTPEEFCAAPPLPGFSSMLKNVELDAYRFTCPPA